MTNPNPESDPVCVVVLGPYRSGTSVTARVLHRLGVNFGPDHEMFGGDAHNPGGYYERADINRANTDFIRSAGGTLESPGAAGTLASKGDPYILRSLNLEWRVGSALCGIKDPRMCATLPAWLQLGLLDYERTRIVHVTRDPDAIAKSVIAFPEVREYCDGTPEGARQMVDRYLTLAQRVVSESGLPHLAMPYEQLVAHPEESVRTLGRFLNVTDEGLVRAAAGEVGKRRSLLKLWSVEYPRRAMRRIARAIAPRRT